MSKLSSIQERISELGSGIITMKEGHIELRGFSSSERLADFLNGKDCSLSFGVYPNQPFKKYLSSDYAHFIVKYADKEEMHWQYVPIFKGIARLKINGVFANRIIKVRKEVYELNFQFIGDRKNKTFDSLNDLKEYLSHEYNFDLPINEKNE